MNVKKSTVLNENYAKNAEKSKLESKAEFAKNALLSMKIIIIIVNLVMEPMKKKKKILKI